MFALGIRRPSAARQRRAALVATAAFLAAVSWQDPASSEDAFVTYKSISPDIALEMAQAALKKCRDDGLQVAVVVTDRFGQTLVLLRDRFAGLPAATTAAAKAYTSLSFRMSTASFVSSIETRALSPELGRLPHIVMLAGGLPIEAGGTLLGAIGVSGLPAATRTKPAPGQGWMRSKTSSIPEQPACDERWPRSLSTLDAQDFALISSRSSLVHLVA